MSTNRSLSEDDLQALEMLGWHQNGDVLIGDYRTGTNPVSGLIRFERDAWQFYIIDCPPPLLQGCHGGCFRKRPDYYSQTLHWVHFHTPLTSPLSGILAIAKIIRDDLGTSASTHIQ